MSTATPATTAAPLPESPPDERRSELPSWLAPLLILVVVVLGYGIAPARLPLVGEETCRALHGIEMVETGDWIIATNQYVPILDRPPGQYWALALVQRFVHELDPVTLRLSMALLTLLTGLLSWWYTRRFFSEAAALVAGLAYPTMGHVFDLGRRAESDGLFAGLLAAALLVWHYGYASRWRPAVTWGLATGLAAAATLTKGLQGPVAFFGTVYLFLLLRRDWRTLFSVGHLAGLVVFVGSIAIWQVPFQLQEGWAGTYSTWIEPGSSRASLEADLLAHLVSFPFEMLSSTLPWSLLLFGLFAPSFWRTTAERRSVVLFLIVGIATIAGPIWITADAHGRYAMPLYPLVAVLAGAVAGRSLDAAPLRAWPWFVRATAGLVALVCLATVGVTLAAGFSAEAWVLRHAQPWWLVGVLALLGTGVVVATRRALRSGGPGGVATAAFAFAAFLAVLFNGAILNTKIHVAENIGPEVLALRESLPDDVELVSFRFIHHKFVYWYGERIPILAWPESEADIPEGLEYFATDVRNGEEIDLPFEWEPIACLNMDRKRREVPHHAVLVGRRLPDAPGLGR